MLSYTKTGILVLFVWCVNILFGAVVFNTLILYPNYFHDVPGSLELTMEFLKVKGPQHFFPPIGGFTIFMNVLALVAWRKNKKTRYMLLISLLLLVVFEFIFSVAYFWKLNTILFIEGTAKHTVAYLEETAFNFRMWHRVRLGTTGLAALISIFTFLTITDAYAAKPGNKKASSR